MYETRIRNSRCDICIKLNTLSKNAKSSSIKHNKPQYKSSLPCGFSQTRPSPPGEWYRDLYRNRSWWKSCHCWSAHTQMQFLLHYKFHQPTTRIKSMTSQTKLTDSSFEITIETFYHGVNYVLGKKIINPRIAAHFVEHMVCKIKPHRIKLRCYTYIIISI